MVNCWQRLALYSKRATFINKSPSMSGKGGHMAEDYGLCSLCKKGRLIKKEEKEVGGSAYVMLKCDKCNHQVARQVK